MTTKRGGGYPDNDGPVGFVIGILLLLFILGGIGLSLKSCSTHDKAVIKKENL